MQLKARIASCQAGQTLPLSPAPVATPCHLLEAPSLPYGLALPAGTELARANSAPLFRIVGQAWLPVGGHAARCPLLVSLDDTGNPSQPVTLYTSKNGWSLAIITLSDKGAQGLRHDESGLVMGEMAADRLGICHRQNFLLPDEGPALRGLLAALALEQRYDLILTTGGTGLSERDITPQTTASLLDTPLPGFVQAMIGAGLAHTPNAIISRACAGLIGKSLVINFPGSVKAVKENLAAILPALPHALKKIHGDTTDCGA